MQTAKEKRKWQNEREEYRKKKTDRKRMWQNPKSEESRGRRERPEKEGVNGTKVSAAAAQTCVV